MRRASTAFALAALLVTGWVAFSMEYRKDSAALWRDLPQDVRLAIDFVKANAGAYGIDPARLGLFGFSAGGHLALLAGVTGQGPSSGPGRVKALEMKAVLTARGVPHKMNTPPEAAHGWDTNHTVWVNTVAFLQAHL